MQPLRRKWTETVGGPTGRQTDRQTAPKQHALPSVAIRYFKQELGNKMGRRLSKYCWQKPKTCCDWDTTDFIICVCLKCWVPIYPQICLYLAVKQEKTPNDPYLLCWNNTEFNLSCHDENVRESVTWNRLFKQMTI